MVFNIIPCLISIPLRVNVYFNYQHKTSKDQNDKLLRESSLEVFVFSMEGDIASICWKDVSTEYKWCICVLIDLQHNLKSCQM